MQHAFIPTPPVTQVPLISPLYFFKTNIYTMSRLPLVSQSVSSLQRFQILPDVIQSHSHLTLHTFRAAALHIQVLFPTMHKNNFSAPTCFGYVL